MEFVGLVLFHLRSSFDGGRRADQRMLRALEQLPLRRPRSGRRHNVLRLIPARRLSWARMFARALVGAGSPGRGGFAGCTGRAGAVGPDGWTGSVRTFGACASRCSKGTRGGAGLRVATTGRLSTSAGGRKRAGAPAPSTLVRAGWTLIWWVTGADSSSRELT